MIAAAFARKTAKRGAAAFKRQPIDLAQLRPLMFQE
jgi:hypothetical protein